MARAYSEDLRRRVVEASMAGASCRAVAARFGVSVSFVVKLMQRWRASGSLAARPVGGRRSHRLAEHAELVRRLVATEPDLTLEELRRKLADEGIVIGRSSIDRYLSALGLTRKKKTSHAAEQARPDVARARAAWRHDQPGMSHGRLVFVDETWAKTNMARRYGRAPRGRRLVAAVPHGHWKTSTFLAGLRRDGITAPCVLDGPINGRSFRAPRRSPDRRPFRKRIIPALWSKLTSAPLPPKPLFRQPYHPDRQREGSHGGLAGRNGPGAQTGRAGGGHSSGRGQAARAAR